MSLTDEQLLKLWAPEPSRPVMGRNKILEFARAIESAATAPLLERIAELERELEALRKDAERYRWLTTGDKVYSRFREAYDAWDGSDAKTGFDAAIDAAMKEHG
jgi:hypothetical protein